MKVKKEEPKQMLIKEIQKTFKYCYDDSELYADYLKSLALIEYKRAFKNIENK